MDTMARKKAVTSILPEPPLVKKTKSLHVEIDEQLSLRLKMTLLLKEANGDKESKKDFIASAVEKALDEFDHQFGGRRR